MKYTFEKAEKSAVKFTIDYDMKELEAATEKAYQSNKSKYSVQGFRKGRVPRKVLESVYGQGLFIEDAINNLFNDSYFDILDKEPTVEVIDKPELSVEKIDDKGVTLVATVAVKPEITIGDYKGIKFNRVEYNVKDEQVDAELDKIRERNSRLIEVTDRAVVDGDTANINFSGSVSGVKFEGGTAENYDLVIGSGSFIPGFEEQVLGMTIGEEKDINVTFPKEYQSEELAGKDAVFAVKVNSIKVKQLPEADDEFIKEATGEESLDIYRQKTKANLEEDAKKKAENELENNIIKYITDESKAEIPEVLVERQIDSMVKDTEYRLMYQGLKLEDYLKYMGTDMAAFRDSYKEQAKEMVKSQLVIDKIIREEKIEATEAEIDAKIEDMAKSMEKSVEEYKKTMQERQTEYMVNEIVIQKLFKFLKENNEIV